jgi:hypothetical protein
MCCLRAWYPKVATTSTALTMARAIESLVATAGVAIEKLQAHATSARALEAAARARLDALPPPADGDHLDTVKTRATLRVVSRSLHARLRDTLRALEGARAAVDAALLAHHRGNCCDAETAESTAQSFARDARSAESDLAEILQDAEEDGLFAELPALPDCDSRADSRAASTDGSSPCEGIAHREAAGEAAGEVAGEVAGEDAGEVAGEAAGEDARADLIRLPDSLFATLDALGSADQNEFDGELRREAEAANASRACRAETLRQIVATLRIAERDVDAKAALVAEMASFPDGLYSRENFAYGTTSFETWVEVARSCPPLVDAMRALSLDVFRESERTVRGNAGRETRTSCEARDALEGKPRCVVFGSSFGWLAFYAALGHRVRCVGYEILQGRVDVANRALGCLRERVLSKTGGGPGPLIGSWKTEGDASNDAKTANGTLDGVAFSRCDCARAPLGDGAAVVLLTSQCWDDSLKSRVAERLRSEDFRVGALVVDYGDWLRREACFGDPLSVAEAPTSWNPRQRFYVFQKKRGSERRGELHASREET